MSAPHRLLEDQIHLHFGPGGPPPELAGFLAAVNDTYERLDADRARLEHSLGSSSDALVCANAEMRGVLEALPDLFLTLDRDGRILTCHAPEEAGLLGGSVGPREAPGQLLGEIAAPRLRARLRGAVERMGAGIRQARLEYSLPVGERERHSEARLVSLPAGRILCIVRDVTDQRRAEEALRRSVQHYRLLFEGNPQPMWVFDRETLAFLAVNRAAIEHYGWSRREFLAMTVKDIRPPEEIPALLAAVGRIADSPLRPGVFRHRKKDGTVIEVETIGNPIAFLRRPAILVLANDVTEHRRLEEQFRQAQRMEAVGRLAGGVAHDFNNLLTVISGYSEMLLQTLRDRAADQQKVQQIQGAARRAAALTRQLLAFGRRQVLDPCVLDLNAVVQGLVPMLSRLLGEHIQLETPCAPGLGRALADHGQIEQVVMNLAINARDAMPHGGQLTIGLQNVDLDHVCPGTDGSLRSGPHVMLTVCDTGCGMDATTRARAFEPFFTTKEVGKGTGLGLATVYGIVEQSGGAIQVESQLGQGSTFRVYLPRVAAPAETREPVVAAGAVARGRETVLVVEDEPIVRALEREVLTQYGYHVLVAADAREALGLVDRTADSIELLVTDVVMPGTSGRELAAEFARRRPGARVLYVSGYASDAFVDRGLLPPGTAFLQKPFSPETLARRMREVLDGDRPAQAA